MSSECGKNKKVADESLDECVTDVFFRIPLYEDIDIGIDISFLLRGAYLKEFSTLRGAVVVLDKSVQDFSIDIHGLIATALLCVFHSLKLPDEGGHSLIMRNRAVSLKR